MDTVLASYSAVVSKKSVGQSKPVELFFRVKTGDLDVIKKEERRRTWHWRSEYDIVKCASTLVNKLVEVNKWDVDTTQKLTKQETQDVEKAGDIRDFSQTALQVFKKYQQTLTDYSKGKTLWHRFVRFFQGKYIDQRLNDISVQIELIEKNIKNIDDKVVKINVANQEQERIQKEFEQSFSNLQNLFPKHCGDLTRASTFADKAKVLGDIATSLKAEIGSKNDSSTLKGMLDEKKFQVADSVLQKAKELKQKTHLDEQSLTEWANLICDCRKNLNLIVKNTKQELTAINDQIPANFRKELKDTKTLQDFFKVVEDGLTLWKGKLPSFQGTQVFLELSNGLSSLNRLKEWANFFQALDDVKGKTETKERILAKYMGQHLKEQMLRVLGDGDNRIVDLDKKTIPQEILSTAKEFVKTVSREAQNLQGRMQIMKGIALSFDVKNVETPAANLFQDLQKFMQDLKSLEGCVTNFTRQLNAFAGDAKKIMEAEQKKRNDAMVLLRQWSSDSFLQKTEISAPDAPALQTNDLQDMQRWKQQLDAQDKIVNPIITGVANSWKTRLQKVRQEHLNLTDKGNVTQEIVQDVEREFPAMQSISDVANAQRWFEKFEKLEREVKALAIPQQERQEVEKKLRAEFLSLKNSAEKLGVDVAILTMPQQSGPDFVAAIQARMQSFFTSTLLPLRESISQACKTLVPLAKEFSVFLEDFKTVGKDAKDEAERLVAIASSVQKVMQTCREGIEKFRQDESAHISKESLLPQSRVLTTTLKDAYVNAQGLTEDWRTIKEKLAGALSQRAEDLNAYKHDLPEIGIDDLSACKEDATLAELEGYRKTVEAQHQRVVKLWHDEVQGIQDWLIRHGENNAPGLGHGSQTQRFFNAVFLAKSTWEGEVKQLIQDEQVQMKFLVPFWKKNVEHNNHPVIFENIKKMSEWLGLSLPNDLKAKLPQQPDLPNELDEQELESVNQAKAVMDGANVREAFEKALDEQLNAIESKLREERLPCIVPQLRNLPIKDRDVAVGEFFESVRDALWKRASALNETAKDLQKRLLDSGIQYTLREGFDADTYRDSPKLTQISAWNRWEVGAKLAISNGYQEILKNLEDVCGRLGFSMPTRKKDQLEDDYVKDAFATLAKQNLPAELGTYQHLFLLPVPVLGSLREKYDGYIQTLGYIDKKIGGTWHWWGGPKSLFENINHEEAISINFVGKVHDCVKARLDAIRTKLGLPPLKTDAATGLLRPKSASTADMKAYAENVGGRISDCWNQLAQLENGISKARAYPIDESDASEWVPSVPPKIPSFITVDDISNALQALDEAVEYDVDYLQGYVDPERIEGYKPPAQEKTDTIPDLMKVVEDRNRVRSALDGLSKLTTTASTMLHEDALAKKYESQKQTILSQSVDAATVEDVLDKAQKDFIRTTNDYIRRFTACAQALTLKWNLPDEMQVDDKKKTQPDDIEKQKKALEDCCKAFPSLLALLGVQANGLDRILVQWKVLLEFSPELMKKDGVNFKEVEKKFNDLKVELEKVAAGSSFSISQQCNILEVVQKKFDDVLSEIWNLILAVNDKSTKLEGKFKGSLFEKYDAVEEAFKGNDKQCSAEVVQSLAALYESMGVFLPSGPKNEKVGSLAKEAKNLQNASDIVNVLIAEHSNTAISPSTLKSTADFGSAVQQIADCFRKYVELAYEEAKTTANMLGQDIPSISIPQLQQDKDFLLFIRSLTTAAKQVAELVERQFKTLRGVKATDFFELLRKASFVRKTVQFRKSTASTNKK